MSDRIAVEFYEIDETGQEKLTVYTTDRGNFFVSNPGKLFGISITPLTHSIEILVSVEGISPKNTKVIDLDQTGYCVSDKFRPATGSRASRDQAINIKGFNVPHVMEIPFVFAGDSSAKLTPLQRSLRELLKFPGVIEIAVFDVFYQYDFNGPDKGYVDLDEIRVRKTEKPAEYHRFVYAEAEDLRAFGVDVPPLGDHLVVLNRLSYRPLGYFV